MHIVEKLKKKQRDRQTLLLKKVLYAVKRDFLGLSDPKKVACKNQRPKSKDKNNIGLFRKL